VEELAGMSARALQKVRGFVLGHEEYGEVRWPGEVDLSGLGVLDDIVVFAQGQLLLYPAEDRPPVGEGLNHDAEVTLNGCWPVKNGVRGPTTDAKTLRKYEAKLRKFGGGDSGVTFRDYDPAQGKWAFAVQAGM
jgi:nuclear pore complex protein Nup98-Nup96